MKTLSHKIAYMTVFVAMILLMGERAVPHHHCAEGVACGNLVAEAVHFGYGECDECEDSHSHDQSSEGNCCGDIQFYLRVAKSDLQVDKKTISFNAGCYVLCDLPSMHIVHTICTHCCCYKLKIPDIGASYMALRAPPVA